MFSNHQLSTLRSVVESQLPRSSGPEARKRAEAFLESEIISSPTFPDFPFDAGNLWESRGQRRQERYLHGFIFFSDWYNTVLNPNNSEVAQVAAEAALHIVRTWVDLYQEINSSPTMAYHDETTAQRLINLISLEPLVRRIYPQESADVIEPLMKSTSKLLAQEDFHATGNNHGMFQDLALMYYSILTETDSSDIRSTYFKLSMSRLKSYFSACFTSEGVHVENTPTYHLMVSRHVSAVKRIAVAAGHPDADYYGKLISKAEKYAIHALMPNAIYPPISDTQQLDVGRSGMQKVFTSPGFAYATSQGRNGVPPEKRSLVLPESGYAMYRSKWGDPDSTFAFFSAAYNADYHKHSDDLSLFLRSGDIDLLRESGPYSYDYTDPLSKYAYSQFAHNSLVVDGQSLPRTDGGQDKVSLNCSEDRENGFSVVGTNSRYADTIHKRTLDIREVDGRPQLQIADSIVSNEIHEYQLLWHLGTDLDVVLHGHGFELFHEGKKVMDLLTRADCPMSLSLHEGEMKPRPLGWWFPRFGEAVPAKVVVMNFRGKTAALQTSIRLPDGTFNYLDRGISPSTSGWSCFRGEVPLNYLLQDGQTPAGGQRLTVVFTAIHQPGDFTYNYKATVDEVDTTALYILDDFGDQGSYYHSDHRSEAIFRSVQKLIRTIADERGIEQSNIAAVGSSKGGTAALIHGIALPAGRIIVGAPQTRIGTFVEKPHQNILEFMAGGTAESDVEHLDQIMDNAVQSVHPDTQIAILVGENDHHLKNHIMPMVETMKQNGLPAPHVTVLPDLAHSDIGSVYRFFLAANLEQWTAGQPAEALPYVLSIGNQSPDSVRINVYTPAGVRLAFSLFRGPELLRKRNYSSTATVVFEGLPIGSYRVRVYLAFPDEDQSFAFTTRRISVMSGPPQKSMGRVRWKPVDWTLSIRRVVGLKRSGPL